MSKTKVRFNIMDALILLTVLAVVSVLLYVFVFSETDDGLTGDTDAYTLTYVVEVTKLRAEFADLVSPGTAVIESAKKMPLGTVTAVEVLPYQHMAENPTDGSLALTSMDDTCNLYITIEADATLNGISYSISGYDICVGTHLYLAFADLVCEGYCISLTAAQ